MLKAKLEKQKEAGMKLISLLSNSSRICATFPGDRIPKASEKLPNSLPMCIFRNLSSPLSQTVPQFHIPKYSFPDLGTHQEMVKMILNHYSGQS